MTEPEMNVATAKAVGYALEAGNTYDNRCTEFWLYRETQQESAIYRVMADNEKHAWKLFIHYVGIDFCSPDCPHSLLALMRETILAQNKVMLLTSYLTTLRFVIANDKISGLEESITMLNATPLQQVEAFLKTMGLWREDYAKSD